MYVNTGEVVGFDLTYVDVWQEAGGEFKVRGQEVEQQFTAAQVG